MHGENNNRLSATVGECYWVLQLESATSSTLRKMTAFIARVKWTSIYCKGEPVFIARVKWTSIYRKGEVNQYLLQGWSELVFIARVKWTSIYHKGELVFIARVKWTSIYRKGEVN